MIIVQTPLRMKLALLYLAAITGAEVVTSLVSPLGGIICHLFIFVALIVHSSLNTDSPNYKLLLALCLVPLTRILSLSMPLAQFPLINRYVIIYTILFLAGWLTMRRINFTARQIGLAVRRPYLQLAVGLSGVAFGIIEYLILRPKPIVPEVTWVAVLLSIFIMIVGTGFVEEFIFRGVAQRASIEVLGRWGIFYIAFLFAILHLIHQSPIDLIFVFAVGLFFGWVVNKTGSLLGVTLSHGITNILLYVIFPFVI